jgi:Sulfotransferase family
MSVAINKRTAKVPPPIFVIGAPRSGTTLTAKILDRHSRIFMPGETHFFDDVYARRRELGDLQDAESVRKVLERLTTLYRRYDEKPDHERIERLLQTDDAVEKLTRCASYKEILSCFMEMQMRFAGKMRWGNNVPKDIFHVKDILTFYPDAKFVVCVRDVRDFLLSYKNQWRNIGKEHADRIRSLYHPVVTSLLWMASAKQIMTIQDLVAEENLMMIRYESLVRSPEKVVRQICRFIGEEFEYDMLNVDEANSSFEVTEKGIYSSSVGRWRRRLTNEEIYIAQNITKGSLEKLGYATADVKINPLKVCYLWATLPYGLWRALHANRAVREPLLPYLARRIAAL